MDLWKQTITIPLDALGLSLEFRLPDAQERMDAFSLREEILLDQVRINEALPKEEDFGRLGLTEIRIAGLKFRAMLDRHEITYGPRILKQVRSLAIDGCEEMDALFASERLGEEASALWRELYFRRTGDSPTPAPRSDGSGSRSEDRSEGGQEVQGLSDNVSGERSA